MIIDKIALLLLIIGGINWGAIGIFQFDIVAWIFGGQAAISEPRDLHARRNFRPLVHFPAVPRHERNGTHRHVTAARGRRRPLPFGGGRLRVSGGFLFGKLRRGALICSTRTVTSSSWPSLRRETAPHTSDSASSCGFEPENDSTSCRIHSSPEESAPSLMSTTRSPSPSEPVRRANDDSLRMPTGREGASTAAARPLCRTMESAAPAL